MIGKTSSNRASITTTNLHQSQIVKSDADLDSKPLELTGGQRIIAAAEADEKLRREKTLEDKTMPSITENMMSSKYINNKWLVLTQEANATLGSTKPDEKARPEDNRLEGQTTVYDSSTIWQQQVILNIQEIRIAKLNYELCNMRFEKATVEAQATENLVKTGGEVMRTGRLKLQDQRHLLNKARIQRDAEMEDSLKNMKACEERNMNPLLKLAGPSEEKNNIEIANLQQRCDTILKNAKF